MNFMAVVFYHFMVCLVALAEISVEPFISSPFPGELDCPSQILLDLSEVLCNRKFMRRRIVATVSKSGCNLSFWGKKRKKKVTQANSNFIFRKKE